MQPIKFKVMRDLPAKVREKVLGHHDMTLDEMTILVAESEAMDVINASLKPEHSKVPPSKAKPKEDAMPAVEKPLKKKSEEKPEKEKLRKKLPDEAYHIGCWICGGQHRCDSYDADRSNMLCEMCGKEKSHVTAVCLQQFADSYPAGQPGGRPATPGPGQSGMVAMEERRTKKNRSYAQVVATGVVPATLPHPLSSPLSDIELTGLNGRARMVGEATVGLRVSGVDQKLQTRVIVVEDLPEGQEMLLACDDMKQFGLFTRRYVSASDTLHMPGGPRKTQRGGGKDLRRMEDAFVASEVDSEPLTIDKTVFRHSEDSNVKDIPGLMEMPKVIRDSIMTHRGVFTNDLSASRKIKCEPLHLAVK